MILFHIFLARSPMFAHCVSSIEGLTTIRAFNAETQVRKEFYDYQNINSSAWFLFVATSRGFVSITFRKIGKFYFFMCLIIGILARCHLCLVRDLCCLQFSLARIR